MPPPTSRTLGLTPNGDSPEFTKNHPLLKGRDIPTTGRPGHAIMLPTKTLLLTAPPGLPVLYALDRSTGKRVGTVKLPAPGQYGMMGYLHRGKQHVVVQVGSGTHAGSLVALRLPGELSTGH